MRDEDSAKEKIQGYVMNFAIILVLASIKDFKLINFGRLDLATEWPKLLQICFLLKFKRNSTDQLSSTTWFRLNRM